MKIVHYSHYPLASAPYNIVKCLKKYTKLDVELVNFTDRYNDGRVFPSMNMFANSQQMIANADILHIHNYLPEYLKPLINKKRQKIVCTLHSVPKMYNADELVRLSNKPFIIRQPYQIQQYRGEFDTIPTLIDIYDMKPNIEREERFKKDHTRIVNFAPSNRKPSSAPDSKGYAEVLKEINVLKESLNCPWSINHYLFRPYLFDLEQKSLSHFVIDDVLHSAIHLTGFFGLSYGCVVLEGISDNDFLDYYNGHFTKKTDRSPFIYSNLKNLFKTIYDLGESSELEKKMEDSRKWMEEFYNPQELSQEYVRIYENLV